MANPNTPALITLGPFLGLATTAQGPYDPPGSAQSASGANPNRYPASLTAELGRVQRANLSLGGTGSAVTAIAPYIPNSTDEQILANTLKATAYSLFLYDPATATQSFISYGAGTDSAPFDQAVQFGGTLYLNSGRQYSSSNPSNDYLWQYPAPTQALYGYTVTPTTTGGLPAGTYYYAFTQVVKGPNGAFTQETSELGADVQSGNVYPYTAVVTGTSGSVQIMSSGGFTGTNADGSTYTTNVYRQSLAVPVWYLLTNIATNGTYTDTAADSTIQANAQLTFHRDPPPIGSAFQNVTPNPPAIMIHKERTWVFTIVQDADTGGLPQPQLWYSNLGRPWEFDRVNNVLLVGSSATPNSPGSYTSTYGDEPVWCGSLSSVGVMLKTRTLWVLYGDDPSTFVVRQIFGALGTRARQSVAFGLMGQTLAMFWLSEYGVMVFDGSTPLRIDEDVRSIIRSIPFSDRIAAVGMYANLTYYISFPTTGITLGYFTQTNKWFQLPYATSFAYSIPSNPGAYAAPGNIGAEVIVNEVTAVRTGTNFIDSWFAGGEGDLGSPQTVTWTSPLTDSGSPGYEKVFTHVVLLAPIQTGMATVTLVIDANTIVLPPFDLSKGPRNICEVPQYGNQNRGFLNSLSVSYQTIPNAAQPIIIYGVAAYGEIGRTLNLPQ